jgi:hypothetical protein
MNILTDKLLITKRGSNNFWHQRNDDLLSDRNISDFDASLENEFVLVEKDGSQNFRYLIENVSIKASVNGMVETGFDRYTLRARLEAISYTPYLLSGAGVQTIDSFVEEIVSNGSVTQLISTDKKIQLVLVNQAPQLKASWNLTAGILTITPTPDVGDIITISGITIN